MSSADEQDAGAGLPGPPYPQQPEDGDRPVPLRGRPERTQDPGDWSSDGTEAVSGHAPDRGAEELARRTDQERTAHADGDAAGRAPRRDHESSYPTDQEQGAAQPGPDV